MAANDPGEGLALGLRAAAVGLRRERPRSRVGSVGQRSLGRLEAVRGDALIRLRRPCPAAAITSGSTASRQTKDQQRRDEREQPSPFCHLFSLFFLVRARCEANRAWTCRGDTSGNLRKTL